MGLLKSLITLGVGVYAGVYMDQNYKIPKVDDPKEILKQVQEWLENYKK